MIPAWGGDCGCRAVCEGFSAPGRPTPLCGGCRAGEMGRLWLPLLPSSASAARLLGDYGLDLGVPSPQRGSKGTLTPALWEEVTQCWRWQGGQRGPGVGRTGKLSLEDSEFTVGEVWAGRSRRLGVWGEGLVWTASGPLLCGFCGNEMAGLCAGQPGRARGPGGKAGRVAWVLTLVSSSLVLFGGGGLTTPRHLTDRCFSGRAVGSRVCPGDHRPSGRAWGPAFLRRCGCRCV